MQTWNTQKLIEEFAPESLRPHILSVCATKGKWKGFISATCPRDPNSAAVWRGIVCLLAPARNPGIGSLLMMGADERRLFDLASRWAETLFTILTCVEPFCRWSVEEMRWAPDTREQVQATLTLAQAKKAEV